MNVGSYHIESLIAETPLGALYAGVARGGEQRVMVYRVRPDLSRADGGDARLPAKLQAQSRLLREARVPGLPKLLDVGRLPDQTVYLVWSAVSSESLVSAVARHRETSSSVDAFLVEMGQRLARTLARAHAEGVYHLSLTPAQVMVADDPASDERIALLGLGLATLLDRSRAGDFPEEHRLYAAPEQRDTRALALPSPGAADVYALGVLLGQLLGERSDLKALLSQMCAADPGARPSMADVSAQLQVTQPSAAPPKMAAPEKPVPPRAPHAGRKSSEAVQRPALAVEDAGFTQADSLPNMRPIGPAAGGAGSAAAPSALARDSAGERSGGEVDRIGSLFGNFRVVRKIGEGGMGVVYEAEHTKIGRRAAVKLLHGRYAESDGFARRFLNEARAVNIVRHPGLVEIFEFGKLPDGTLFYIMEYLEGEAMDRRIEKRQGPFAEEEAINIALQVARALAAAHEKGIVHRDLKPGNIMFVPDPVNPGLDWVKLLDFGIAKVRAPQTGAVTDPEKTGEDTGQGVRLGTPLYMAPEQHGGAVDVDGRADVFSLGVVLYELLAGKTPFRNNSLSLLISKPPPIEKLNPTVRPQISDLVRRMMAMEAEGRPTMREVEAQLTALLASPQRPHRRLLILGAVGVVTLLLGVLSVLLWLRRPPSPAELRAQAMAVLQTALSSGDASLQSLAAAAIGGSHDLEARSLLRPVLAATQTPAGVREAAVRALSELGDNEVQAQLLQIVQQDSTSQGYLTISAASALAQLQHPRGMEVLRQVLASGDELRRVQAALALLEHGDFSGSELLWARIGRSGGATRTLTSVLGRLALSGDERARNRLAEEFATLPSGEARIYVAYALSRLGDEAARSDLRRLAGEPGASGPAAAAASPGARDDKASEISDRLLAARLLSALGDAEVGTRQPLRTWLLSVAADPRQADARRELALASLGDSGDATLLAPLGEVLTARGSSPRLLIAAAGAILTLLSGEPARLAEQSLGWARSALRGESVSERELAVLALGDLDDPATIGELGQALRDREVRVRRQAAIQLARKDLLPALRELRGALVDSDVQVRLAGVESMSKLLQTLRKSSPATAPQTEAGAALRTWLEQAGDASSELDRVLRAGLLFQLGDQGRKASLVAGLASKDPLVRKLSISLLVGAGEERAIEKALADPDRAVRLAAALHLAERGHPQGLQILRGFVAGGDVDGLLAYTALRRLKQESPPPPGLSTLLSTAELSTRYAVVDILRELPPGQALLLLQLASIDRASVVRRLVLAVAAGFYRGTQRPGFLELILVLRADSDVIVRAYAAQLIAELGRVPARPPVSAEKPVAAPVAGQNDSAAAVGHSPSDANRRTDGGVPATGAALNGQLYLEGEELVRVQIDRGPPTLLSDKPVVLPAGRHVLRYLGGQQEFTLAGAQTLRLRVPVRLSDQLLADGREALSRSDLSKAQEHLERLRRLLQRGVRGPAPPALQADVAFELARLYEARGQLRESLSEYNRCLAIPAAQRRPELNAALPAMLTRMAGRAGRIQIFTMAGGRCTMTQELLLPPGEQIISIGRGQTRSVFSQIGSTNKLMACE
jgi:serine/threonine protein kinase/HEAT repeat protein